MEAWRFFDYAEKDISPLWSLSYTAEQWRFAPFSQNIVAIPGYLKDVKSWNNTVLQAWTLPNCSIPSDFVFPYTCECCEANGDSYLELGDVSWTGTRSFQDPAAFCGDGDYNGADSACYILVEGIGKTTIGPANSNIVALSHGITFLLTTIITLAIMGSFWLKPSVTRPNTLPSAPNPFPGRYNPPPDRSEQFASSGLSKEVAHCSDLFREMYKLDLLIWSRGNDPAGDRERTQNMRKVNALFAEIREIVNKWRLTPQSGWTVEQQGQIDRISGIVNRFGQRRYDV